MSLSKQASDPIYVREPNKLIDGIPVFVETDEYIENYERIASDELEGIDKTGENPFIPEVLWNRLEQSTAQLVKKYSKPDDMILDAGVGLGRLLSEFSQLQRFGIDVSIQLLRRAQQNGINVCCASIQDIPYQPNLFDIIVCTDVLEHVFDLNAACINLLGALKDDGILIVRVPYREDLGGYLKPDNPYKFVHMRNFDESSLRLLFERILGQQVLEWNTAGYAPIAQYFKYILPIPKRGFFINMFGKLLLLIQKARPDWYEPLARIWFQPLEINMIIRRQPLP